jgi:hypothetical protein
MKRDGKKIAGVVAWDTPMAKIADRAGVDLVSVGDSVGVNLWGRDDPLQVAHFGDHSHMSLTEGLLHPFSGVDHVLAMVAVGLWASQLGRRCGFSRSRSRW